MNYIFEKIGNTPLCLINRINPYKNVKIYAKLEYFNPGGSVKDRIAYNMILEAEKRGELTKDKIVVEATSGNTGIGLAMVCAAKGYKLLIAMSEGASIERRKIMRAYGADLVLTPANKGTDGAIEFVYNLIKEEGKKYYCTDQFNNPDNWKAHYHGTANEIWRDTDGKVNTIVASMGTTGTLMGITRRMRELNPKVRVVGVEPYLGHNIQGLKNMKESYVPGIFNKKEPDAIWNVHDEEAYEMARRLAKEEGLLVGMSSGAAMVIALKEAALLKEGIIVVIFPDSGERYLSTSLFPLPDTSLQKEDKILFYNTFTRKKEPLVPISGNTVKMYSCGPTANQYMHLGLGRRMLFTDLITKFLEYQGFNVKSIVNITDIDDKTVLTAIEENKSLNELTGAYIDAFFEDIKRLNIKPATLYPRASEHIQDMFLLTEELIKKGFAYVKHGSVYFDISKLNTYGRLSRLDLSSIEIGKTVDLDNYDKDHPADFTIFKRISLEELKRGFGYESAWGKVRPGWHIECVTMAYKYLDSHFDIHTSSSDLIFPHHENEIAISRALWGKNLANMWLHCEPVFYNGKKMSLANKNVVTVRELTEKGYSGRQIRFFLIKTHYRKPIHFTYEQLNESCKQLQRLDNFICNLKSISIEEEETSTTIQQDADELRKLITVTKHDFTKYLRNDLNVPGAIGVIFNVIRRINPFLHSNTLSPSFAREILSMFESFNIVLSIMECSLMDRDLDSEELQLIRERDDARKKGDWRRADEIREILSNKGISLVDTNTGIKWNINRQKEER